jgi:ketosteroid isomerase-like protein
MTDEQRNAAVVRELMRRWNAGDHDSILDLYRDDIVMTAGPEWPDPGPWEGKEQVAGNQRQWLDVWESVKLEVEEIAPRDDKVLAIGRWLSRGRASGVGGEMPAIIVLTLEDGLVTRFSWFQDADEARRAAGLSA